MTKQKRITHMNEPINENEKQKEGNIKFNGL